ncbi:GNAT family N-acetyltransferase [Thermococci archaeon]|nr:MAG: GNAT family N-acetyltransferase [Thermococci archaeon]RLF89552.1 MAG: GNAT family N-acetyltransferase [Thermococci archaeon]
MRVKIEKLKEWNEEVLNRLVEIYMEGYAGLREYGGESVPYARRYLRWCWGRMKDGFFVARLDDEIVGFAVCSRKWHHKFLNEKVGYIGEFVIDKAYQGHHIGGALMKACLEYLKGCKKIVLEVGEKNENAIKFYERWGFKKIGKQENWIIMLRED